MKQRHVYCKFKKKYILNKILNFDAFLRFYRKRKLQFTKLQLKIDNELFTISQDMISYGHINFKKKVGKFKIELKLNENKRIKEKNAQNKIITLKLCNCFLKRDRDKN